MRTESRLGRRLVARCQVMEQPTPARANMTWEEPRFAVELNQQEVSEW
jgi:hypothetical protein